MAEKDTQPVLDDYLDGRIDEEAYLAQNRPWPNYKDAYRPVVEFAKAKHLSVVAAAIPRRLRRLCQGGEPRRHSGKMAALSAGVPLSEFPGL